MHLSFSFFLSSLQKAKIYDRVIYIVLFFFFFAFLLLQDGLHVCVKTSKYEQLMEKRGPPFSAGIGRR